MPYYATWLIEDEVIFYHYYGKITSIELKQSLFDLNKMIDFSTRVFVHVISDVGDVSESLSLAETMSVVNECTPHPRVGWTITMREPSRFIKFISSISRQLLNYRSRSVNTLEEAFNHLEYMDPTLSWEKLNWEILPKELKAS